jgi:predicted DNA-binding transcriptional regulator AlpA
MPKRLLTATKVRGILRISDTTLWQIMAAGDIATVTVGGRVKFTEGSIAAYIRRHTRQALERTPPGRPRTGGAQAGEP